MHKPLRAEATLLIGPTFSAQINRLEELWRTNPNATIADTEAEDSTLNDDEPAPVQTQYVHVAFPSSSCVRGPGPRSTNA